MSAYQYTIDEDEDPESDGSTVGRVDRIPDALGVRRGQGAAVFFETIGPKECPATPTQPPLPAEFCNISATKLHEIGHLFGAEHGEAIATEQKITILYLTNINSSFIY